MRKSFRSIAAAAMALALLPATAMAHTKLISSTPAANATTVKAELVMTGMPGMADHAPMKMPTTSMMGKDGKSMTLMVKRKLTPGTYKVSWSAAGADTHRMGSEFSFTVK